MSGRRNSTAEYARHDRRQERNAVGRHGYPKGDAHHLKVGKVLVLCGQLVLERKVARTVGVSSLAQKGQEAKAAREPREYLEEAVEPEGTLYAALLQAHHEQERDERQHAEHKSEEKRHGVDEMQLVVHDVGRLEAVRERLGQVFEVLLLDEAWTLEVEVGAEALLAIVVRVLAEEERVGRVEGGVGVLFLGEKSAMVGELVG